jgi:hypothetical protein
MPFNKKNHLRKRDSICKKATFKDFVPASESFYPRGNIPIAF